MQKNGTFIACAQGYYNVIRRLFLGGSLASPKDNSKRSSKDILSCGRISEGITLNDSLPLDRCKKLILFHMQIDTLPRYQCWASFIYSNGISVLSPVCSKVPGAEGQTEKAGLVLRPLLFWGRSYIGKIRTFNRRGKTELSKGLAIPRVKALSCLGSAARDIFPLPPTPEAVSLNQCLDVRVAGSRGHSTGECLDAGVGGGGGFCLNFPFLSLGCWDLNSFEEVFDVSELP